MLGTRFNLCVTVTTTQGSSFYPRGSLPFSSVNAKRNYRDLTFQYSIMGCSQSKAATVVPPPASAAPPSNASSVKNEASGSVQTSNPPSQPKKSSSKSKIVPPLPAPQALQPAALYPSPRWLKSFPSTQKYHWSWYRVVLGRSRATLLCEPFARIIHRPQHARNAASCGMFPEFIPSEFVKFECSRPNVHTYNY
jgi:hypothetical protein